jgi:hypothetical protein
MRTRDVVETKVESAAQAQVSNRMEAISDLIALFGEHRIGRPTEMRRSSDQTKSIRGAVGADSDVGSHFRLRVFSASASFIRRRCTPM